MARRDLYTLSATEIAAGVRSLEFSPLGVTEASLAGIELLDPKVHAWVYVDRLGALEAARTLEAAARAGRFRGPLHGVPVALKDIFDAAGLVTASGAGSFAHRRPEHDARSVALLREAGAVILGKTVTTPFAFADPSVSHNPWNLEPAPGGPSSGSAAAVAARMAPVALGSQTIGSTVRPAAYCGTVGLKGTFGRINTEGVTPLSGSLDHVGILARTVEDVALGFFILAEPRDSERRADPAPPAAPRFGLLRGFGDRYASPEVGAHLDAIASAFSRAGARVVDVELPESGARIHEVGRLVLRVGAAAHPRRWVS